MCDDHFDQCQIFFTNEIKDVDATTCKGHQLIELMTDKEKSSSFIQIEFNFRLFSFLNVTQEHFNVNL